ncbi:transposase [Streptomyces virginiae]|uniref:transposase n=1 Tax=Streptomyces virginiae TaxID=1961 RepID=UPI0033BF8246
MTPAFRKIPGKCRQSGGNSSGPGVARVWSAMGCYGVAWRKSGRVAEIAAGGRSRSGLRRSRRATENAPGWGLSDGSCDLSRIQVVGMFTGRGDLTNEESLRLKRHLPKCGQRGGGGGALGDSSQGDQRDSLPTARTGVPWRDLPARFGKWKTVYERHRRWSADGTWDRICKAVLADADATGCIDWSMVSVDSTSCRAHQNAAGARKKPPRVPGRRTPRQHRPPMRGSDAPGWADMQDSSAW